MTTRLLTPTLERLPGLVDALRRGWSPDNVRGEAAACEILARIEADVAGFVERQTDPEAKGGPVTLPDGSQVARLPGRQFWIWDGAADDDDPQGFCGVLGLRWQHGTPALPPHVLGHVGYAVVAWQRARGHATAALRAALPHARDEAGLPYVELTTDPDNLASQRVIERSGGVLWEPFVKPPAFGGVPGLRYRIDLASSSAP